MCTLGQIGEFVSPDEIFIDYTYYSSASKYWLDHARVFARDVIDKLNLTQDMLVLEIASNDGYLLKYFKESGIKVLGIEPSENVSSFANQSGIETLNEFFTEDLAKNLVMKKIVPRLVVCNNVLAHVPDIIDFTRGLKILINEGSVVSIEAPSMLQMLKQNYFDTIYHEHFSYLSATSVNYLASEIGVSLFNVEKIPTHGGSYRYWLGKKGTNPSQAVEEICQVEVNEGIRNSLIHKKFSEESLQRIRAFENLVNSLKGPVLGFGAAAKATVLINASNIDVDKISAILDSAESKQNKFIPGTSIPVHSPSKIVEFNPQNIIIFPWNIAQEIAEQARGLLGSENGCEFWTFDGNEYLRI